MNLNKLIKQIAEFYENRSKAQTDTVKSHKKASKTRRPSDSKFTNVNFFTRGKTKEKNRTT